MTTSSLPSVYACLPTSAQHKLTHAQKDALARDLNRLASPTPGSSIACIIEACTSILHGVLDELQIMQKIETEVVSREKDWVENRLRVIAQDVATQWVDADGQNAAWRM